MEVNALTPARLRAAAGPAVYGRGQGYVGQVVDLTRSGSALRARVAGSDVYAVELEWAGPELSGRCSCPYNEDGSFCKHLVAAGLSALQGAPDIAAYLEAMSAAQLRDLLLEIVGAEPAVAHLLGMRAMTAAGQDDDAADHLQVMVDRALGGAGFMDWRESNDFGHCAQDLLDELEQYLDDGEADLVRPALGSAIALLSDALADADDSDGAIFMAGQRAVELYARACCEGEPDRVAVAQWLVRFGAESMFAAPLADFLPALDDAALDAYRQALAQADDCDAVRRMRLELADHDGDADLAVELLAEADPPQYGAIFRRLRGERADALLWLDRAVAAGKVSRIADPQNPYWIDPSEAAPVYVAAGRPDDAIAVMRAAALARPGAASMAALLAVAEPLGRRESERDHLLTALRGQGRAGAGPLMEIALHEGDLDAAWQVADTYGAGSGWQGLADASAATAPLRAAELYLAQLEQDLSHADTRRYPIIAQRLRAVRDLLTRAGQAQRFAVLLAGVRADYRRRRSLMAELDRAGL